MKDSSELTMFMGLGYDIIEYIVHYLTDDDESGIILVENEYFDTDFGIDKNSLLEFLKNTQPDNYNILMQNKDLLNSFFRKLKENIAGNGAESVLHNPIKLKTGEFRGEEIKIKLYYPKYEFFNNKSNCEKNIFSVMNQLKYADGDKDYADLCFFVNGIPIITCLLEDKDTYKAGAYGEFIPESRDIDKILMPGRCIAYFGIHEHGVHCYSCYNDEIHPYDVIPLSIGRESIGDFVFPSVWEVFFNREMLSNLIEFYCRDSEFPKYYQIKFVEKFINDIGDVKDNKYLICYDERTEVEKTIKYLLYQLLSQRKNKSAVYDKVFLFTDDTAMKEYIVKNAEKDNFYSKRLVVAVEKDFYSLWDSVIYQLRFTGLKANDERCAFVFDYKHYFNDTQQMQDVMDIVSQTSDDFIVFSSCVTDELIDVFGRNGRYYKHLKHNYNNFRSYLDGIASYRSIESNKLKNKELFIADKADIIIKTLPKFGQTIIMAETSEAAVEYYRELRDRCSAKLLIMFDGTIRNTYGRRITAEDINGFSIATFNKYGWADDVDIVITGGDIHVDFGLTKLVQVYIDKKLDGYDVVNTLQELNKQTESINQISVLDFVNEPTKIKRQFNYYRDNYLRNFERKLSTKSKNDDTKLIVDVDLFSSVWLYDFTKDFSAKFNDLLPINDFSINDYYTRINCILRNIDVDKGAQLIIKPAAHNKLEFMLLTTEELCFLDVKASTVDEFAEVTAYIADYKLLYPGLSQYKISCIILTDPDMLPSHEEIKKRLDYYYSDVNPSKKYPIKLLAGPDMLDLDFDLDFYLEEENIGEKLMIKGGAVTDSEARYILSPKKIEEDNGMRSEKEMQTNLIEKQKAMENYLKENEVVLREKVDNIYCLINARIEKLNSKYKKRGEKYTKKDLCKNACIDYNDFSKISQGKRNTSKDGFEIITSKDKVIGLAVALEFNLKEAELFLELCGHCFGNTKKDVVVKRCIEEGLHDAAQINVLLQNLGIARINEEYCKKLEIDELSARYRLESNADMCIM